MEMWHLENYYSASCGLKEAEQVFETRAACLELEPLSLVWLTFIYSLKDINVYNGQKLGWKLFQKETPGKEELWQDKWASLALDNRGFEFTHHSGNHHKIGWFIHSLYCYFIMIRITYKNVQK